MSQLKTGVLLGIVSAAMLIPAAASAQDEVIRQMRDRAQIEALMWRYVRALDTADGDAYAAAYTPDGQFGSGSNATKGRDALRKMVSDMRQRQVAAAAKGEPPRPAMYHVITNATVEFVDKDTARMHSYWMTVFGAAGENTPPRVAAVGRGVDHLVRLNGQWLTKLRDVAPQD